MAFTTSSYMAILSTTLGMRIEILGLWQYFPDLYHFFRLRHGDLGKACRGASHWGSFMRGGRSDVMAGKNYNSWKDKTNTSHFLQGPSGRNYFLLTNTHTHIVSGSGQKGWKRAGCHWFTWCTVVSVSTRRLFTAEGVGGHGWERYGRRA